MAPRDLLKSVHAVPLMAGGRHGDSPAVIPVDIKKYDVVFHRKKVLEIISNFSIAMSVTHLQYRSGRLIAVKLER